MNTQHNSNSISNIIKNNTTLKNITNLNFNNLPSSTLSSITTTINNNVTSTVSVSQPPPPVTSTISTSSSSSTSSSLSSTTATQQQQQQNNNKLGNIPNSSNLNTVPLPNPSPTSSTATSSTQQHQQKMMDSRLLSNPGSITTSSSSSIVASSTSSTTGPSNSSSLLLTQSTNDITSSSNRVETQQPSTTSLNLNNGGGSGINSRMPTTSMPSKLMSLPPPPPLPSQSHSMGSNSGGIVNSASDLNSVTGVGQTNPSSLLPMQQVGIKQQQMQFDDPVEQSLASFEQPMISSANMPIKQEVSEGISGSGNHHLSASQSHHLDMMSDMSSIISSKTNDAGMNGNHLPLIHQLGLEGLNNHLSMAALHGLHNNGFGGMEITGNGILENITSNANGLIMGGGSIPHLTSGGSGGIPSIFDLQQMGRNDNIMSGGGVIPSTQSTTAHNMLSHGNIIKEKEKCLITPKPIESMMPSPPEKKMTPPDIKVGNTNFAQAFKATHEQNLKNASSWSSLASAGSPQNTPTSNKPKPAMDSFQQFRNKAKEKMDRQKLLEQQELKRSQKEAAEKELKRQQEQQKQKQEIDTGR